MKHKMIIKQIRAKAKAKQKAKSKERKRKLTEDDKKEMKKYTFISDQYKVDNYEYADAMMKRSSKMYEYIPVEMRKKKEVGLKWAKQVIEERLKKGFNKATNAIGNIGDLKVKTTVSGYDIPDMINKKSSHVAIQLAQLLFKDAKDLDKKSMLVYLLPLFAIACIILAIIGLRYKVSVVAVALIGGVIVIGGLYKLIATDLSNLPVQISIENGLWQTMYGYLLICILSVAWLVMNPKE